MRPKKKRVGHEQPDAVKDEAVVSVGGTDGEKMGDDEDWGKTTEVDEVGYGRPQEVDEDEYI